MPFMINLYQSFQGRKYAILKDKPLGQGGFGTMYQGFAVSDPQTPLAIKKMPLDKNANMINDSFKNESKILAKLDHPNIVRLHDYILRKENIYLVYEFCEGGDLNGYLQKGNLTECETFTFLQQIFEGYWQLYKKKIAHRNLKPENILIKSGVAKIGEFGCARFYKGDPSIMVSQGLGSPAYISLEAFANEVTEDILPKGDVWSLGVMLYKLLYGKVPWASLEEVKKLQLSFPAEPRRTTQMKELVRKMLIIDPKKRIGWEGIAEGLKELNEIYEKFSKDRMVLTDINDQLAKTKRISFLKTQKVEKEGNNMKFNVLEHLGTVWKAEKNLINVLEHLETTDLSQGAKHGKLTIMQSEILVEETNFENIRKNVLEMKRAQRKACQENQNMKRAKELIYFKLNLSYFFSYCSTLFKTTQMTYKLMSEYQFKQILFMFYLMAQEVKQTVREILNETARLKATSISNEMLLAREVFYNEEVIAEQFSGLESYFIEISKGVGMKKNNQSDAKNLTNRFLELVLNNKERDVQEGKTILRELLKIFFEKCQESVLDSKNFDLENEDDRNFLRSIRFTLVFFEMEKIEEFWENEELEGGGFADFYERYDLMDLNELRDEIKRLIRRKVSAFDFLGD